MTPIDLDELEQAAKDATPFEDGEPEGEAYGVPGAYFAKWKATSGGVFFSKYDAIYSSKITPATVIALIAAARENAALRGRVKELEAKPILSQAAAADLLDRLMSDISEQTYCAGWMAGLEYELWESLIKYPAQANVYRLDDKKAAELKSLSELAGGWCDCDDFIPMQEWLIRFAEYQNK